jgi:hypothetical protein
MIGIALLVRVREHWSALRSPTCLASPPADGLRMEGTLSMQPNVVGKSLTAALVGHVWVLCGLPEGRR